ncbi:MAG: FAD-binding oxidoreductase [Dongiaceae bacterium]
MDRRVPPARSSGPAIDAIETDPRLPDSTDVVVIGGGIIGVSTALALAERGVRVALCEKGALAAEQSSRNWGWVRNMGRDPRELPLMMHAMRLWTGIEERLGGTGFRRSGILYLCHDEQALGARGRWLAHASDFALDTRLLGPNEVARVLPGSSRRWKGALYTPSDGRAEPQKAVPVLARHARALGAIMVVNCAVRGLETTGGRVSAVITEKGRVACGAAVLAGGAWSRLFCRSLGLTLPQLKVLASVMRVDGVDNGPDSAAWGPGFAFRRRLDGGYTVANGAPNIADIVPDSFRFLRPFLPLLRIERKGVRLRFGRRFLEEASCPSRWDTGRGSPFEAHRVLDPAPAERLLESGLRRLCEAFPAFKTAVVRQSWAGFIDATPDTIPVISGVDPLPGFFVATGFSGHGFGIGPAAGQLMADLVTNARPIVDPTPFRFSRFSDGSRPVPVTGV